MTRRVPAREPSGEPPPGRDEGGFTTLEWLLIVAAVGIFAALAVVIVQGRVEDTASDIAEEQPRRKAAEVAGGRITREARAELSATAADNPAAVVDAVNGRYGGRCDRLAITYGGLGLAFTWHDAVAGKPRPAGDAAESACAVTETGP